MIFDSDRYHKLATKYKGRRKYDLPEILLLDDFSKEKEILENLIKSIPKSKTEAVLSRLVSDNTGAYLSAWFELRLFGWLRMLGKAEYEPDLHGRNPDASLLIDQQIVAFEARVIEEIQAVKNDNKFYGQLLHLCHQVFRPYWINVKGMTLTKIVDEKHFILTISNWLDKNPTEILDYGDDDGGHLVLEAHFLASLDSLEVLGPTKFSYANANILKGPLKKKASQHSEIRASDTPYVIALLVEPFLLSAEEVVEAWFGGRQIELSMNEGSTKILGEKIDQKGLHYWGRDFVHTGVSGTLVFKRRLGQNSFDLNSWWIENPKAKNELRSDVFPVVSRWIALDRSQESVRMGWRKNL